MVLTSRLKFATAQTRSAVVITMFSDADRSQTQHVLHIQQYAVFAYLQHLH